MACGFGIWGLVRRSGIPSYLLGLLVVVPLAGPSEKGARCSGCFLQQEGRWFLPPRGWLEPPASAFCDSQCFGALQSQGAGDFWRLQEELGQQRRNVAKNSDHVGFVGCTVAPAREA